MLCKRVREKIPHRNYGAVNVICYYLLCYELDFMDTYMCVIFLFNFNSSPNDIHFYYIFR